MAPQSRHLILKEGPIFLVADEQGNVGGTTGAGSVSSPGGTGLYYQDTRYLSLLTPLLCGKPPLPLGEARSEGYINTLRYSNPALSLPGGITLPAHAIYLERTRFINGGLHERLLITSYHPTTVSADVSVDVWADFRDIFDIRGFFKADCGEILPPVLDWHTVTLSYRGLDRATRS
ncbi:MAG TPA: glycogen debranching N-terminal domain-containing protein, partial [Chloroflexia bacterium]|nr:glycogen debranching N-terminal domain-containing protein [Chloroflexia bacterium]